MLPVSFHLKKKNYSKIDQNNTPSSGPAPTNVVQGREFKERAGFNRRRGAMRRRVHQVNII